MCEHFVNNYLFHTLSAKKMRIFGQIVVKVNKKGGKAVKTNSYLLTSNKKRAKFWL